ncbi:DUF1338 family protein [Salmonella enterica]|nr:DUF1338 family protein [Salmonella enterica]
MANTITADEIREHFSQAMSAMYQQEVPQYGTLLELVADVNLAVLENNPKLHEQLANADELARLNVERHGAIRVGTAEELSTLRRIFAIMGMYPVSYYDLSQAGVPVHSTAFRPIDEASLSRNPFRMFTSLLRLELIENAALRQRAAEILSQRDIFTSRCRQLLDEYDEQGGFSAAQAEEFVRETLETFRWHRQATVDEETYRSLHREHRLIADVVCFPGCHINHLTPRTLDIDRVQAMMPECGITPKILIEGPPRREVPILLRQTSFKALEEQVLFVDEKQGIQLAPALVACSAWLSVNGGEGDTLAKMLFGYGLLQLLFMLRLMPWYLSQPFNASFWSFSFGVSALATTGLHLGHGSESGLFHILAVPLFIFTNAIIALLLVRTFLLLVQGTLLIRTERAALLKTEEKNDRS